MIIAESSVTPRSAISSSPARTSAGLPTSARSAMLRTPSASSDRRYDGNESTAARRWAMSRARPARVVGDAHGEGSDYSGAFATRCDRRLIERSPRRSDSVRSDAVQHHPIGEPPGDVDHAGAERSNQNVEIGRPRDARRNGHHLDAHCMLEACVAVTAWGGCSMAFIDSRYVSIALAGRS